MSALRGIADLALRAILGREFLGEGSENLGAFGVPTAGAPCAPEVRMWDASTGRVKIPCHRGDLRGSLLRGHEGRVHDRGASAVHPSTSGAPTSSIRNSVQGLAHRNNGAAVTGANREDVQCVEPTQRWWRVRC
jgi:hypothetical protein